MRGGYALPACMVCPESTEKEEGSVYAGKPGVV